ncbi:MAG: tetratricopeptide repeat protein [Candidatus Thorarchaeota archaeon]
MPRSKTQKNPVKLVRSGLFHLKRKNWKKAQRKFEEALEDEDFQQNPGVWSNYAISLANLNKLSEAQEAFMRALDLDKKNPSIWIKKGLVEYQLERFKDAAFSFEKARNLDKKDFEILIFLARALYKQKAVKKSIRTLEGAINRFPQSHQIRIELAKIYSQEDEMKKAEEVLEAAIGNTPHPEPGLILGQHLLDQKDYDQAIRIYERVLSQFPNSVHAQYGLGIAKHALGDWPSAIAEYNKARGMFSPKKPPQGFWINTARVLKQLKRYNEAIDALYRAKRTAKPPLEVFILLAELYLEKDMPEKAKETLEEASRVDKTNPVIPYYMGLIELRYGGVDTAKKHFKWSLELNPDFIDSKFQLAFLISRENARESYTLALEILDQDSSYYPARQLAARLAFSSQDYRKTIDLLEMAIVEDPTKRAQDIEILLKAWLGNNESEKAVAFFKHLFETDLPVRDLLVSNPFVAEFLKNNSL